MTHTADGLKGATFAAIEGVKEYYRTGYDAINQLTGGKLGEVVNAVGEKMEVVKGKFSEAFGNVKNTVMTIFENIKNGIVEKNYGGSEQVKGDIRQYCLILYHLFGTRLKAC